MAVKQYTILEVAMLATVFKKSTQTINRWIAKNDDRLTSERARAALLKPTSIGTIKKVVSRPSIK